MVRKGRSGRDRLADGTVRSPRAIEKLATKYAGGCVAIVTHGGICPALLGLAEDTPMCGQYESCDVPTGSFSEIVITEVGWYLLKEGVTHAEKE